MPPPSPSPGASGQSSLEYVGLLTLVGAVLALGGPLVGGSGIGAEVARVVRTGICIVGGDVCRPADARAAELSPCTLADARRGGGGGLTIFSVRIGENHHWTVARRSDGSVLVTRDDGDEAGGSGGLGLELGALRLGVDASLSLTGASGASWEFRDTAAAARFLADVKRGREARRRPAWRFGDLGAVTNAGGGLGVHLGGADGVDPDVAGVELSAGAAVGARVGRGETTLYLRLGGNGPQVSDRLGHSVGLGTTGPAL